MARKAVEVHRNKEYQSDFHLFDFLNLGAQNTSTLAWLGTFNIFTSGGTLIVPANMRAVIYNIEVTTDRNCYLRIRLYPKNSGSMLGIVEQRIQRGKDKQTTVFEFSGREVMELSSIEVAYSFGSALSGVTGSINTGEFILTVNDSSNLQEGDFINIIGVSGSKKIRRINDNGTLLLTTASNTTVSGSSISRDTTAPSLVFTGDVELKSVKSNLDSDFNMALYTDSIGWQAAGGNVYGDQYWTGIIESLIRKTGVDVKKITRSFGGSSADTMYNLIRTTDAEFADLSFISEGMNDSVNGSGGITTYINAIKSIKDIIRGKNKNGTIILMAPSSTDDAGRSSISDYRTALQALFTTDYGGTMSNINGGINGFSSSQKIIYIDLSTAYASSSTTDFSDSNPKIHPNAIGHGKLANNTIWPVIQACPWKIFNTQL